MAGLPGFQFLGEDTDYAQLYRLLWPTPNSSPPAASAASASSAAREPPTLTEYIDVWTGGEDNAEGGVDVTDVDENDSEPTARPGPPQLRFINLNKHPKLRVHSLLEPHPPILVVRDEYTEFMTHALQVEKDHERRFFLTGHPGIGMSVGACYFLFWLLASGQSVFLIPETDVVYYFSEAGVQRATDGHTQRNNLAVRAAIKSSWVLIDVDIPSAADWYPREWIKPCSTLVWTSPLRQERLRRFRARFLARVWYMSPWSLEEIAVVTKLEKKDPAEIQARLDLSGPVARSLFFDSSRAGTAEIDSVIRRSFARGLFEFATSQEGADEEASHRMYLVRPQESWDEDGVPRLVREEPTYIFLSSYVAARTVELMTESAETFRERLAAATDDPPTRRAAGKLVESILHRALFRGSVDPFGVGGHGLSELALIGEAPNFVFEAHMTLPPPPLYLRPESQNFAAVDAIVVTDTAIWLVQSSVSDRYSLVFKTLLAILLRLEKQGIKVNGVRLVYCLIGTDERRVGSDARSAARKLTELKAADSADRTRELGQSEPVVKWLMKLDVEGYSFVTLNRLTRAWPAPEEDTAVA
ncbi:hypothetical protein C8R45DRAFT_1037644 [Mycena sanguinolenta]|nr:hypothetical protein C8R45DRAFT_1037644 [Mycena sanguinolenta]